MEKNPLAILLGALLGLFLAFLVFHFFSSFLPSLLYRPPPPPPTVRIENGYYVVHYEWRYPRGWGGKTWIYDTRIKVEAYKWFRNRPRVRDYSEYVDNPADDQWISHLAGLLENAVKGWGDFEKLDFVLSFVQGWPYTSDDVTTGYDEYPRYPIETIVDGGGDCEDTSILFASLVKALGYEVVLLLLEEDRHMAVGVAISREMVERWNRYYPLTYYEYNGKIYAYCETTEGWELGRKPPQLSAKAKIIPV
ncbi:MAG: hypothetical protein QXF20_04785 [Candidatus Hadarchaeales archaeon]